MKKHLLSFMGLAFCIIACNAQFITHHGVVPSSKVDKPTVGIPIFDPRFGTVITRISDSKSTDESGIFPQGASRQAWNANDSLLLLKTGNGYFKLYDARTYSLIKPLYDVCGEDVFWHPTKALEIVFAPDHNLYSYNVATEETKLLHSFPNYKWITTKGKGNLSNDGKYYAFVGQNYDEATKKIIFKDILVYDLEKNKVISQMHLPENVENLNWVSISPKGNYIVVNYGDDEFGDYHGLEVYDKKLHLLWQLPLGNGNSDLGIDSKNDEILVIAISDPCTDSTSVFKLRLKDGKDTQLLKLPSIFDMHISCSHKEPSEWCFISTFDNLSRSLEDSCKPFENEIFALQLYGNEETERIAHHNSKKYSAGLLTNELGLYIAEPHASVNNHGNKILFASNWRQEIDNENSIDTYIVDFSEQIKWKENPEQYINAYLHRDEPEIYDACGKEDDLFHETTTENIKDNLLNLPCDIYCLTLMGSLDLNIVESEK